MDNTFLTRYHSLFLSLKFALTFVKPHLMMLFGYNGEAWNFRFVTRIYLRNFFGIYVCMYACVCVGAWVWMHTLCA